MHLEQDDMRQGVTAGMCPSHLQGNVAIYFVQLVYQLIDLLNDQVLALPDRAPLVLPAGLRLGAGLSFRAEGDGRCGPRQLVLLTGRRCLLRLLTVPLLPLQRLQLELHTCRIQLISTV